MDDAYFLIVGGVLLIGQIACMFSKKVWVRLWPLLMIGIPAVVCFALYALSGFTNWGYLMLLILLLIMAGVIGVIWFFYGFACLIQKAEDYTGL